MTIIPLSEFDRRRFPAPGRNTVALALMASGQAVYEWCVPEDVYIWSDHAAALLVPLAGVGDGPPERLFDALPGEAARARSQALFEAAQEGGADGLPYDVTYPLCADGPWIEETGLRFFGDEGTLDRVVAILRVLDEVPLDQSEPHVSTAHQQADIIGPVAPPVPQRRPAVLLSREEFETSLQNAIQGQASFAYVALAVDGLALINETYGFAVADQVIDRIASLLIDEVKRDPDGRPIDAGASAPALVGQISGAKLGLLLPLDDAEALGAVAGRVGDRVAGLGIRTRAGLLKVTASLGCVLVNDPGPGLRLDAILARAQSALARARMAGGNGFSIATPGQGGEDVRQNTAATADKIISALNDDRLILAYQPVVCAGSGQTAAWECLARLRDTDGEVVEARDFIPAAEAMGLVRRIDLRVLERALDDLEAVGDLRLSVNISGSAAMDTAWLEAYLQRIAESRPVAERLTVEITEHAEIEDVEGSALFVSRLKDLGCTVAIDDFGAGYTSFRTLRRLNVDMVKIDGTFVRGVALDRDNQIFARSLIGLAQQIGLKTVAECVGTEEDAAAVRAMGADFLQGFYYGRPAVNPEWRPAQAAAAPASRAQAVSVHEEDLAR